jgi:hypothetical protein
VPWFTSIRLRWRAVGRNAFDEFVIRILSNRIDIAALESVMS